MPPVHFKATRGGSTPFWQHSASNPSAFPYALLYTVKPDGIRILAVMNLKRRPAYWVGRE